MQFVHEGNQAFNVTVAIHLTTNLLSPKGINF